MRTVTFADPKLVAEINQTIIPVWHNQNPDVANGGAATQPKPTQQQIDAYPLGGGAGNMRAYFCSPSGKVFHYIQGYWSPEQFADEMRFAIQQFQEIHDVRKNYEANQRIAKKLDERISQLTTVQSILVKQFPQEFNKPVRLSKVRKEHAAIGLKIASYHAGKASVGQDVSGILTMLLQQNLMRGVIV